MRKRKLCVVTGSRAEYGLLYWLLKEIQDDDALELQLVATGMHLSPEFGLTYRVIETDGFRIDAKVEMLLSSDSPVGIAKSMGLATIGFADAFERLRPDLVVMLGDRFEILAAAQAAMAAGLPIAHIHGGETTEGAIDEAIRHAVTKMAHFHFPAAEAYRRRIVQLGEAPERVLNFGAPGLDNIARLRLLERVELEQALGFGLGTTNFLVTYHPVTLGTEPPDVPMRALLAALDRYPDAHVVITKPNADTGGRVLMELIDAYAARFPGRVFASTSLGQLRYLSMMRLADVVVGNSSSGLIEAPALGKPTVNVGMRQAGRLKAVSVIDTDESEAGIAAGLALALTPAFEETARTAESLYGDGGASKRIKDHLKTVVLDGVLVKTFHDLGPAGL